MTPVLLIIIALVAYSLGGVNGAIVSSRYIFHDDIRNHGSGNAGLTNFNRTYGVKGIVLVLAIDVIKTVLADAQARVQPPTDKGRRLKIYYMTQTGIKPPNFVVFCNSRELFHFSYQRYLENQIRATFGLEGTPVRMVIRQKGDKEE